MRSEESLRVAQPGEGTTTESDAVAHARTSLDGGDAQQESQHGAFPPTSMGLEGLRIAAQFSGLIFTYVFPI